MAKTIFIIEEIFQNDDIEKRKEKFAELFLNIIRKSENLDNHPFNLNK